MATNKPLFKWLSDEIGVIKSQRFHQFCGLPNEAISYVHERHAVPIVGDYGIFLREFGNANMFNGWGGLKEVPLLVYPLEEIRRQVMMDGRPFVAFGDCGDQHVFFDERLIISCCPSPVFLLDEHRATQIYSCFSDWLFDSYLWAKSRYTRAQWSRILNGARPFSKGELEIVRSRRQFRFELTGFDDDGNAILEVENRSNVTLPFLSVGVKDVDDAILVGTVWVDVGGIGPGETMYVTVDCYKDQISRDKLVLFYKPDPVPEERDRYWEFRKFKKIRF